MEDQPGHATDTSECGRAASIGRPTYDECRAVNVINPLGLPDHGEGSLHRVIDSPTRSDSSDGSWDPVRELYAIMGGEEAPTVAAPPNLIRFKCDNPFPERLESSRTSNGLK